MAKNKHAKSESRQDAAPATEAAPSEAGKIDAVASQAAEAVTERVEAAAGKVEALVEKTAEAVAEGAEAVAEKAEAVAERAQEVGQQTAEAVQGQAAKAEAGVTETAGQVASFVKERLEQAQRQWGQLEAEAHKALQTLVTRGRESGRVVLERLSVNELRASSAVRTLEKRATWVRGEVRQRLTVLQGQVGRVVGGVASQSQVDAIHRELDRLTRRVDALAPEQTEAPRETPRA